MTDYIFRPGIAMIELIFAIVVIGITIMSAPMLLSQSVKSNMTAFQQESIAMAATQASAVMTYAWDESNTEANQKFVLSVTNGDADLEQNTTGTLRRNTTYKNPISQRLRRFSNNNPSASIAATPLLWSDSNATTQDNLDDIDDFNVKPLTLTIYSNTLNPTNEGDYIDVNISITTQVDYGKDDSFNYTTTSGTPQYNQPFASSKDVPSMQTTNIKRITTTLTSNAADADLKSKNIVLRAFMCNIGAANPISLGGF